MYDVYLGTMLCPVAPESLQLKVNNKNKTLTLINTGEVNILKKAGLSEISFDLLLPNVRYPFAMYKSGFRPANYFLGILECLKRSQQPFMFKVIRKFPNGKLLFSTNMSVSLESYSVSDDVKIGFDTKVSINLKQYVAYGTKTCKIKKPKPKAKPKAKPKVKVAPPMPKRQTLRSPAPAPSKNKTYTVVRGDCLWIIARRFYGDGSKWPKIYEANKDKIRNPNLIYVGQAFVIPG